MKAKVLIGYIDDEDEEQEEQRLALRMYNSHLHNIEVITFDGLVRTSDQIIHANLGESTHSAAQPQLADGEDIPF